MKAQTESIDAFRKEFEREKGRALQLLPVLEFMHIPTVEVMEHRRLYTLLARGIVSSERNAKYLDNYINILFNTLIWLNFADTESKLRDFYNIIAFRVDIDVKLLMPRALLHHAISLTEISAKEVQKKFDAHFMQENPGVQSIVQDSLAQDTENELESQFDDIPLYSFADAATEIEYAETEGILSAKAIIDIMTNQNREQAFASYLLLATLLERRDLIEELNCHNVSLNQLSPNLMKCCKEYHEATGLLGDFASVLSEDSHDDADEANATVSTSMATFSP